MITISSIVGMVYILLSPPLIDGAVYFTPDKKTVLVGIGNKGFASLQIDKVSINGGQAPLSTVVQVSNAQKGFFIAPKFEKNEALFELELIGIDEAKIPKGISPMKVYEKQDAGIATAADEIYGVGVICDQAIREVIIHYRYFSLQLTKAVKIG